MINFEKGGTSSSNNNLVDPRSPKVCASLLVESFPSYPSADGVTVAKSIQLKDKFENLGARWVLPFVDFLSTV